ncbi:MAG: BatA domain-containing protein [Methanothrix sp.]|nr:BatA domain-containing protein [Methanothrix sp.]
MYLIRPRPKEISFSSTLFLREGEAQRSAVLSRLISDPLFWVQLLVLCSLSVAAAGPFTTELGLSGSHLVVVLDGSASMQSSFSAAKGLIEPYLDNYERISIILAENTPVFVLQEGSGAEARDALGGLAPKAVTADLSGSMVQAANLLGQAGGNILVVSDFISWVGDSPEDTRRLLQADGRASIVFADSYQGGDNAALVGGWDVPGAGYVNHTALVHNYGSARSVPITIEGPGGSSSQTANLPAQGDYYLSFTAFPGVNKISMDLQDAVAWDNSAYVYVPNIGKKKVLYLGDDGPALSALRSLPNVLAETSADSANYGDFDLIVAGKNASQDGKLNRYIDAGGAVIYIASANKESPEYLPVRIAGQAQGPANLWVRDQGFAEGVHLDEIGLFSFPEATPRRRSMTLIEANGVPVLSYWRLGKGTVIYSGLEDDSDFYQRPEYPIFWYQMVNWITGVPDISQSNRKTGELIPLGEETVVQTPSGVITTTSLMLDEVGMYRFRGESLAANMYDPKESSLRRTGSVSSGEFAGASRETLVEKDISNWFIALAALAILMELAIMRWRRET